MYALQKDIHETKLLGDIHQVNADFSIKGVGREYLIGRVPATSWQNNVLTGWEICLGVPLTHRLLNPDLAGGAILDLGPYPLTWVSNGHVG